MARINETNNGNREHFQDLDELDPQASASQSEELEAMPTREELVEQGLAMGEAASSAEARPRTRGPLIIAIANQKGGVAKTTSVVSLGGALVNLEQEVLLVDLDAQANLTLGLGKDPSRVRGAITEVMFNSATLMSVTRETSIPGLDLAPSNSGMDLAERFLPMRKDYETILRRVIQAELRGQLEESGSEAGVGPGGAHYDFVILDCPPFMGAVTINAMAAADLLIIPTQPEYFSAHALRSMMTTIRQVRNQFNPDLVFRVLITMMDRRNRIHREVAEQIRATFGDGVFQTAIPVDTKLRESAVEGLPIAYHKSQSRSALQYDALAQELIAYVR